MAIVEIYKCMDCGIELEDDGRVFIWDGDLNQTKDFSILMMTYHWLQGSEITGDVSETYCRDCGKFLKIYSIREVRDDVMNSCEVVMGGIKNYIEDYGRELEKLKGIKKRAEYIVGKDEGYYVVEFPECENFKYSYCFFPEMTKEEVIEDALKEFNEEIDEMIEESEETYQKYLNSNYLVADNSDRSQDDYDPLEKVNCPECGREVYKYINHDVPCPRCGKELLCINHICYD